MAGIGFSLRKIIRHDSLGSLIAAYSTAGVISTGPWIISILGIMILAIFISTNKQYHDLMVQFQLSITYLVAGSLIVSSFAQNSFSRYIADQLFLNRVSYVIPNLNGMILVNTLVSGVFCLLVVIVFFPLQSIAYRFLFLGSFVTLSNTWVLINLLTGLRDYVLIVRSFLISYLLIIAFAILLRGYGLEGFMLSYLIGQLVLLVTLNIALYKQYPATSLIGFHFLKKNAMYTSLILSGIFFNMAIWVDKFIFWFCPSTSHAVIGPIRGSLYYDDAIFIAYLAVTPGMAVLLFLIETNFADYYQKFNEAIRYGRSLSTIETVRGHMVNYARNVVYAIARVQTLTIVVVIQLSDRILDIFHISPVYKNLLLIDLVGTSLQVICLCILNLLNYMDKKTGALLISVLFFVLNVLFSMATIYLGPFYYGFGFTIALILTCTYGIYLLDVEFHDLEYKVIMLR